jgi:hypothetical protein
MTIREAAQAAIQVQDACNLSGVLHTYVEAMAAVFEVAGSTTERNRHPVSVCFAAKIADLAGLTVLDYDGFGAAFHACQEIVDGSPS